MSNLGLINLIDIGARRKLRYNNSNKDSNNNHRCRKLFLKIILILIVCVLYVSQLVEIQGQLRVVGPLLQPLRGF